MTKRQIVVFTQFLVLNVFAQSITITKVTLEKQIVSQERTEARVGGEIYIDYEISNPSKDTLYLVLEEFEFLTHYPIVVTQQQEEVENSKVKCGGYFVYNRPPSGYSRYIFDPKKHLKKVSPKSKIKLYKNVTVQEGFCPNEGNKIEVSISYSLKFIPDTIDDFKRTFEENTKASQILKSQLVEINSDAILKEKSELIKEITQNITNLDNEIRYAKNRIGELESIAKIPLFKLEMKSNSVFVNK